MSFSEIVTLTITVVGFIWLGAFKFAALEQNVQEIDKSLYRIDARLDRLESEFHKMDIRVNLLEQRKR
jgi:hypothetical protein